MQEFRWKLWILQQESAQQSSIDLYYTYECICLVKYFKCVRFWSNFGIIGFDSQTENFACKIK